jgi:hypothetical protein
MTAEEPEYSDESVLDSIDRTPWTNEDRVAVEAAIDTMTHAVGLLNGLLYKEQGKPHPDAAAIDRWDEAISECIREREALRLTDMDAVRAARHRYAALIRDLAESRHE